MKRRIIICLLTITVTLSGCSEAMELFASEDRMINSRNELYQAVGQALKEGKEEFSFETEELGEEDFESVNLTHDGFYGSVSRYELKKISFLKKSRVTFRLEISDNYYVEQAILCGEEIPESREKAKKLQEICEDILSKIEEKDASAYEKEKKIHDYLISHLSYGYPDHNTKEDSAAYTAYGALAEEMAVCNGYAQAMKLLCDLSGVECTMVTGKADGEEHAWNQVRLDDEWYHVDPTWDDPEPDVPERILYTYFNVSDEQLSLNHTWDEERFPAAEGKEYNYYQKENLFFEDYEVFREEIADIFSDDSPKHFQVQVQDYSKDRYSNEALQFIFGLSGANSLRFQTVGEKPYTTMYFTLSY